jgi:hypothetical protein
MRKYWSWSAMLFLALSVSTHAADNINFRTFVSGSSIATPYANFYGPPGNHATIAFNFAGNKFVGSVYNLLPGNNQLYSTDLTGGTVTLFGQPIPGASGEVVVGAALGVNQGSWIPGDIYAGSQANGQIYHFASTGGTPTLFATVPSGNVRQIFFDPGSSFGGNMLVTTNTGNIYQIPQTGIPNLLVSVGEDTEGMDIATSAWGPYAGWLLVSSETHGTIRLISPTGQIKVVLSVGSFPSAETISFVPLNLDANDPLQGFYVANYPIDIQFAPASNFTALLGDAIVTDETGGSTAWDVHYNSDGTFTKTQFTFTGNQINQFEDGIFVTSQREASEPGYLEICKASDPAHPVTGMFTFTATIFSFSSGPITVPVGQCSGSIQVPSGAVTVTESPVLGVAVSNVTAFAYDELGFYHDELNSWTQPDLHAIVNVMVGDQDEETLTTFTNYAAPPGLLKLCKVAGDQSTLGQVFTFTVTGGGHRNVYMIQAGPPGQGGNCVLAGNFPVNTQVTIAETPKPPFVPSGITVNEGQLMPCQPSSIYCAVATVIPGITEVTFTNTAQQMPFYNNLGTGGNPYQCGPTGWPVAGSASPLLQSFTQAAGFTSQNSGSVSRIDVGVNLVSGVNSFYVALYTNNAGLPGTLIARWDNLSAGRCPGLVTITGITGLTLTAGTQYFLVVGPMGLSSTTYEVWNLNNQSKTGTHLYSNDGGSTWTNAGTQTLAAFDVL